MVKSIQPVLTRVKPGSEDDDIDDIKNTLTQQLHQEVKTARQNIQSIAQGMGKDAAEREIEESFDDAYEVKKNNDYYFQCLEQFYT